MTLNIWNRPIAITDVETTGLVPGYHEIIEIGLVLVNQPELDIITTFSAKVRPYDLDRLSPEAQKVNGFNEEEWKNALELEDAMYAYNSLVRNAMFAAHNVVFDWGFMASAYEELDIRPTLDYHRLDTLTLAWSRLRYTGQTKIGLGCLCDLLGVERENDPHRALGGALAVHRVMKKLMGDEYARTDSSN